MKQTILIITFLISLSFSSISQQKTSFTFVKTSILNLEKRAKYNDDGMNGDLFRTPTLKKRVLGMFLIDDTTSIVDYNSEKYIKFSAIPVTEKFEMITDVEYGSSKWERNLFLQNVKTKQKYAVMVFPLRTVVDYANSSNELNGNGWLTKDCPKELSQEEKQLIAKYKALIKSADANIAILLSIQKKYITRGYFDAERVNSIDKATYNKNLDALKVKAEQLSDIDRYEDKDKQAQYKLTISELGSLANIVTWNANQFNLN